MKSKDKTIEDYFYAAGWIVLAALLLLGAAAAWCSKHGIHIAVPCLFHRLTGYECPGCGGTRAVAALLQGRLFASFCYHPVVLYIAVVGGWFMVSQSVERLSGHRLRIGMRYRDRYVWILFAIVMINFILKNAFRFFGFLNY